MLFKYFTEINFTLRYITLMLRCETIKKHNKVALTTNTLFLTVLSRYPNATELNTAVTNLRSASGAIARTQEGRHLLWSLYNKVDFIYNY